jgi:hypothetical protein
MFSNQIHEHTLGYVIANGGTLQWEYYERSQDLTNEQVQNLSMKEHTEQEEARMLKNACKETVDV